VYTCVRVALVVGEAVVGSALLHPLPRWPHWGDLLGGERPERFRYQVRVGNYHGLPT